MADTFIKVRIQSEADLAALKAAGLEIKNVEKEAQAAGKSLSSFGVGLAAGIGTGLVTSLAKIPAALTSALTRGIEFNATLQTSEVAIANVLQQFQGLNKEAAKNAAGDAITQIKALAKDTNGTTESLVQGLIATLAASQSAGISVSQNIDLVGKFANALTNAAIPAEQLAQEMRSIVTANIGADSGLARTLGITNDDVKQAREAGKLYEFLTDKLGTLGEAGVSFAVSASTLKDNLDQLVGTAAKPFFDELEKAIKGVNAALSDDKARNGMSRWEAFSKNAPFNLDEGAKFRDAIQAATGGDVAKEFNEAPGKAAANIKEARSLDERTTALEALNKEIERVRTLTFEQEKPGIAGIGFGTISLLEAMRNALQESVEKGEDFSIPGLAQAGKDAAVLVDELAKARGEFSAATEAFADAGRTPEAKLQAQIDQLTDARAAFNNAAINSGLNIGEVEDGDVARQRVEGAQIETGEKQKLLALLTNILSLNVEINAEAQKQSQAGAEQLRKDDERKAKADEMISDLEAQVRIETARVKGNDDLAESLERQRDLAKQLAQIADSDLLPSEQDRAAQLATQTSELQTQLALEKQKSSELENQEQARDRLTKLAKAGPDFDPEKKGGRGARLRDEAKKDLDRQLVAEAAKLSPAEREGRLAEARRQAADAARGKLGRFGGSAQPGQNLNMADPATLNRGSDLGTNPSASFQRLTEQRAVTALPFAELFGPPAPIGAAPGVTDAGQAAGVKGGADQLKQAAGELNQAGRDLQNSGGDLRGAAGELDGAAADLSGAAGDLQGAVGNLRGAITELRVRVGNLERDTGY
jgi:hypothetical protein